MTLNGIRVRFAPSPTGHLHVGGARTALFNWLYARKTGGTFVLRIEDTDAGRSTRESHEAILDGLRWLGLDWDEGPDKEGSCGPYVQSARSIVYRRELERLLESGQAYRCFCTPEELDELRADATAAGRDPKYDGRCRRLPDDEVARRVADGVPHVVRFRLPDGQTRFWDVVRGEFQIDNDELDDFVLLKSDGQPTYNFAVVVDDANMHISHVIRGDDHLSNTPRQVLLYKALGYRIPKFVHLSMILGSDRARLSKRHGAASVQEFREMGFLSDALVNYIALLGWSLDGKTEVFTRPALIDKFSLKRVSKNPAAFDMEKLAHINGEHFKRLDKLERVTMVYKKLEDDGIIPADFTVEEWANGTGGNGSADDDFKREAARLGFILNVMGNRLRGITNVSELLGYFYKNDYSKDADAYAEHLSGPKAAEHLDALADAIAAVDPFSRDQIEAAVRALADSMGVKAGDLIHPCRVALTGQRVSPDIFAVIHLLGRRVAVERLRAAVAAVRPG